MKVKDAFGAGEEILDAVNDAVSRNDFSGLSQSIQGTVNRTVGQLKQEFQNPSGRYKEVKFHNPADDYKEGYYQKSNQQPFYQYKPQDKVRRADNVRPEKKTERPKQNAGSAMAITTPAGKVAGVVQMGLGIAGVVVFGLIVTLAAVFFGAHLGGRILIGFFGILTGCCVYNIFRGKFKLDLLSRFNAYVSCIGDKSYVSIQELAAHTGREPKKVIGDLKKMLEKGMFPQGRLDEKKTTFMLTNEVYEQYMQTERQRKLREEESVKAGREAANRSKEIDESGYSQEVKNILREGNEYIVMVHKCNDEIPGEEMSDKLDRLESIMKKIFDQVKRNPESAGSLRKFMTYYLPTTKKLLQAYIDLERQPQGGENIRTTKREIEDSMDVINEGFERLLDDMFEDTAWDISSDISVMKTMMAQEGLTGEKPR